ncbi:LptA/OstA family protein [Rhodomicrobium sp.]|jgi:lipopolysaccharide export system protein LptA|uniref:LptA/OstA family protein n=1 Tax=Rhodomicrobium sp. TaxID=2720632 RepID=UPI0039E312E6
MIAKKALLAFAILMAAAVLSPPSHAQTPGSGFRGIGSGDNAKKPIDIESDRLEVDDKRHVAIFIGNVSANQGDYNLKAPRLEVTYERQAADAASGKAQKVSAAPGDSPGKAPKTTDGAAADPISSGQIRYIRALGGHVVVTNKKDEQEVTGDEALYDVKGQKITMTGKEVILTQKANVVKGKQLSIDLETGRATVIPEKGRVQAVFDQGAAKSVLPADSPLGGKKKKDAAPVEPQPQPRSGWQPQSQ